LLALVAIAAEVVGVAAVFGFFCLAAAAAAAAQQVARLSLLCIAKAKPSRAKLLPFSRHSLTLSPLCQSL